MCGRTGRVISASQCRLLIAGWPALFMNSPDVLLLTQIAAGDRLAFETLYDRYAPQLQGLLLRILRDPADAEDTLQEVFLQVWRTAARFDAARASGKAWLFLIARSRATDRLRRRSATGGSLEGEPAAASDPRHELERVESAGALRTALAQLPEAQRSAICLAYYGGLTYESVAREQGVPVGTIKTRIRLGMQHLRALLSRLTEEPAP